VYSVLATAVEGIDRLGSTTARPQLVISPGCQLVGRWSLEDNIVRAISKFTCFIYHISIGPD
jgi:hypothetical protein